MISRNEKVRLGIFLVIASLVAIATFIALAGIKLAQSVDTYTVGFKESVSGLEIGAQVKYNGVRVGRVSTVEIDPQKLAHVIATLELREGTPIKADTKAILVRMGITGLKFVELTGGSAAAELLPPGSAIEAGQSFMGTIEGKAEDIAVTMELALSKINTLLNDRNLENFGEMIDNIRNITGHMSQILDQNKDKIDEITDNLTTTTHDLSRGVASAKRSALEIESLITASRPKVDVVVENATVVTEKFKKTATDLAKVDDILRKMGKTITEFNKQLEKADVGAITAGVRRTVGEAEAAAKSIRRIVDASRENVYQSSKSLRQTLRNLEDVSESLRDQPSLLLNSKPPKERTPPSR